MPFSFSLRSLFDQRDLAEITSDDYPGERLIVCRNPLLADERARKRRELLAVAERQLDAVVAAVARQKNPLRGKDKIGLRAGRELKTTKMQQHFELDIEDARFSYRRRDEAIAAEAVFATQGVDHRTPLEQPRRTRRSRRWNSTFCRIE